MTEITVSVVYATPGHQEKVVLSCPQGASIDDAIALSGIGEKYADVDFNFLEVGVYGCRKKRDYVLQDSDRVEIYRRLVLSPTEARRSRAKSKRTGL